MLTLQHKQTDFATGKKSVAGRPGCVLQTGRALLPTSSASFGRTSQPGKPPPTICKLAWAWQPPYKTPKRVPGAVMLSWTPLASFWMEVSGHQSLQPWPARCLNPSGDATLILRPLSALVMFT